MSFDNKFSFKFICICLILLLSVQACGSSATLFVNPSQTLQQIASLEAEASKSGKRLILKSGDISVVNSLYKVTSDSVFFVKSENKIIGFSQNETHSYNISSKNKKSAFGFVGFFGLIGAVAYTYNSIKDYDSYNDNNGTISTSLLLLSFGSYIILLDGQSKTVLHKIKFVSNEAVVKLSTENERE